MPDLNINPCLKCDCWDSDAEGCTMASVDRKYACPLENDAVMEEDDDYDDNDYPCIRCSWSDNCDGWEAQVCPTLNDYYGIDDYDPWDI
jgi:hypothetical protein